MGTGVYAGTRRLLDHRVWEYETVPFAFILNETRRKIVQKIRVAASQANRSARLLRTRFETVEPVSCGVVSVYTLRSPLSELNGGQHSNV